MGNDVAKAVEHLDNGRPAAVLEALEGDTSDDANLLRAYILADPANRMMGVKEAGSLEQQAVVRSFVESCESIPGDCLRSRILGVALANGIGVPRDLARAKNVFEASAEDCPSALYNLGVCLENGVNGDSDKEAAFRTYVRAAIKGSARAELRVSQCYRLGIGTKPNPAKADLFLKRACDAGLVDAMMVRLEVLLSEAVDSDGPHRDRTLSEVKKLMDTAADAKSVAALYIRWRMAPAFEQAANPGDLKAAAECGLPAACMDWAIELWYDGDLAGAHMWLDRLEPAEGANSFFPITKGRVEFVRTYFESIEDCDLVLKDPAWTRNSLGMVEARGRVANTTERAFSSVQVIAEMYDEDGRFIASSSNFIEFNPLLAHQTSPFVVYGETNPEIKTVRLRVKEFLGTEIKSATAWTKSELRERIESVE